VHYRVYFLEHGKDISGVLNLDCGTVDDAYAIAQRDAKGRKIEIWHAGRSLGIFSANIDY